MSLLELIIVLTIMGIFTAIVYPKFHSIQIKAKEMAVKQLVRSLQMSLEAYHLSMSHYPQGQLSISTLFDQLSTANLIPQHPKNPFTNQPYQSHDPSGKIRYISDTEGTQYQLNGYGQNNEFQLLELYSL